MSTLLDSRAGDSCTDSQLGPLFQASPRRTAASRADRFMEFHRANPDVYAELVRRARLAKAKGLPRIGIRRLWEVLRWDVAMEVTRLPGEPRFNNNHAPFYSRLIQAQEPDLADFFEVRGDE